MFRPALVVLTLLGVGVDFGLTPLDDEGLISHRTRSSRSARTDSEHEIAILHEFPGSSSAWELPGAGLVVAPAAATVSHQLSDSVPAAIYIVPSIAPAESIVSAAVLSPRSVFPQVKRSRGPPSLS